MTLLKIGLICISYYRKKVISHGQMDHLLALRKMKSFLSHCYPRMRQIATFYNKMQLDQTIFLQDFSVMFHCHLFANMNVIISIIFMHLTILLIFKIEL